MIVGQHFVKSETKLITMEAILDFTLPTDCLRGYKVTVTIHGLKHFDNDPCYNEGMRYFSAPEGYYLTREEAERTVSEFENILKLETKNQVRALLDKIIEGASSD